MNSPRTLSWDWYPGTIPENVLVHDTAYIETTFSFFLYRSERSPGVEIGRGASTYLGTMFDVSERGQVKLGNYVLMHGARVICDAEITIGDYTLISWNVLLMDSYRIPLHAKTRRNELEKVPHRAQRYLSSNGDARPIRIGSNVWIGFDVCILPGVTIGEGAIIGARSVVTRDVPPFSIVAGNPAQFLRDVRSEERPARPSTSVNSPEPPDSNTERTNPVYAS